MTTYTKETALYDTGAIAGDIQEAGAQVSKYITAIGDEGVKVHPYDATHGQADTDNYAKIDSDGMEIWQKPTGASTSVKVAEFGGDGAQIGQSSGAHMDVGNRSLKIYDYTGTNIISEIGAVRTYVGSPTCFTFGTRKKAQNNYDASLTYNVGDMVLYNGYDYVCIEKITTPESWTSSHWKAYVGEYSVAEGATNIALGRCSHAEGNVSTALGNYSHAETTSRAYGNSSHAEGNSVTYGSYSHAENLSNANGDYSHAEGYLSSAFGDYSHAQNLETTAWRKAQTAIGSYNIIDIDGGTTHPSDDASYGQYAFIIGNGTADAARSNALTVDWSGNVEAKGDYITRQTTLNLGNYVGVAILSSNAGDLHFSIPTGRVFPSGTTISKITFYIVSRASNANGNGYYIIKSASGGSDGAAFDSSASKTFYNANNASKTITTSMWRKYLDGGTNIRIMFVGGNDFFSGTTTIRNYINNNAATVYVYDIVVTLDIPSA